MDLDDLVGREALLVLEVKPDTNYNRTLQLLPLRRMAPAPAQARLPPKAAQPAARETLDLDW